MSYPDDRRYSKDHEWIKLAGDRGTVGITDHAQNQLGDVVFLELPEVGRTFEAGEVFGSVESVKAVSELYAPTRGEVLEVNRQLTGAPEIVNSDPHGQGWLVVLRVADASALSGLMDAKSYEAHLAGAAR